MTGQAMRTDAATGTASDAHWQRFDPRGATLDAVLARRARETPDKPFVTDLLDDRVITYGGIDDATRRIARGLGVAGVPRGAHVAVMMENCPEQLLALWGIARAGRVAVPLNSAAKGQLLAYFLSHADCSAVIVEEAFADRVLEAVADLPAVTHVFVARIATRAHAAGAPGAPGVLVPAAGRRSRPALLHFDDLLAAEPAGPADAPRFTDLAMLMFTSGTTGPSKAIMFSQAQVIYWGTDVSVHHEYTPDDVAYVFLPLFHGNALLGNTMGSLMAGSSIAIAPRFSASRFWSDVRRSRATVFNGVGAVGHFLWTQPPSAADRDHRLERCHLVPVPSYALDFERRYGIKMMSAYGLTDYCLGAAYNTRSRRDKLGSAGLPRRGVMLRIVDDDDIELPNGTPGEIVMRSDHPWGASLGYYKQPEATAASRRNLWFHTGDRGWIDDDGYVWYTDRIKDAIRRRGENISAFEVEEVIRTHPAVAEVAVYPVRADGGEDEVAVSLILRAGAPYSPEALIEHCNRNLAYFMVPRFVEVVSAMPMTLSMKVEKYKLRAAAEANLAAFWDRERAGIRLDR